MKILFVWRTIDNVAGGVERMITTMMNEMVQRGHEVSLFTWDNKNAQSYYPIDDRVKWYKLNMGNPKLKAGLTLRLKRIPKARKTINTFNPDVIMCFENGVFLSTRLFLFGCRYPIISAERNAPSRLEFMPNKSKQRVYRSLRLASIITTQFERYKQGYPESIRSKMVCIHNPVEQRTEFSSPDKKISHKVLLCVARHEYQKNLSSLIEAFVNLSPKFPDWELKIAGDGAYYDKTQRYIETTGKEGSIQLLGKVNDVETLYKDADLFCLPSRWEGFPNALAEAMAHGLPSVGFSDCCGVSDLIKHNNTGILANGNGNVKELEKALSVLMSDAKERRRLGNNAIKQVKQYEPKLIFDKWEELFLSLA